MSEQETVNHENLSLESDQREIIEPQVPSSENVVAIGSSKPEGENLVDLPSEVQTIPFHDKSKPLPQVDPETGIYTDENGEWVTQIGIPKSDLNYIKDRIDQIRTMRGKNRQGREVIFYNQDDVSQIVNERNDLPNIDLSTKIYVNEEGKWGGHAFFGRTDTQFLDKYEDKIRTKKARAANGNISTLYNVEDAQRLLAQLRDLPQVDPETFLYANESGLWASHGYFGESESRILAKDSSIRTIKGRGKTGAEATLYNLEDANRILNQIKSLPMVDEDGKYRNDLGDWGSKSFFGDTDTQYLEENKDKIRALKGRGVKGAVATLFNIEDAKKVLDERNNRPQVDKNGIYRGENEVWGTKGAIGPSVYKYLLSNDFPIRKIIGRGANGRLAALYNLEDIDKLTAQFNDRPQVNSEGVYRNVSGDWGSNAYFGLDAGYLYDHKDQIRTVRGRNSTGGPATLYNIEDARKVLSQKELLPQVNPETGIYTNADGEWGGHKALGNAEYQIVQKRKGQVRTIDGRNSSGAPIKLYNVEDVRRVITEVRGEQLNGIIYSPDQADEMMRSFEIEQ